MPADNATPEFPGASDRDELKEWYEAAARHTSGDMVYDILKDWKEEREKFTAEIAAVHSRANHFRAVANACRNRMANAFNQFCAAMTDADKQSAANSFWAADQDFCLNLRETKP